MRSRPLRASSLKDASCRIVSEKPRMTVKALRRSWATPALTKATLLSAAAPSRREVSWSALRLSASSRAWALRSRATNRQVSRAVKMKKPLFRKISKAATVQSPRASLRVKTALNETTPAVIAAVSRGPRRRQTVKIGSR
jgi:hypothetical protein